MTQTVSSSQNNLTKDERRLIELLDEYTEIETQLENASGKKLSRLKAEKEKLREEILTIVDRHFRRNLKPMMTKLFGKEVLQENAEIQFTCMLNDFFVKILGSNPDEFWKAKTTRSLTTWSSVVLANLFRDTLRRRKAGRKVLSNFEQLVKKRQEHFERQIGIKLERALEELDRWEQSDDEELSQMAAVIRHRYIDGMKYPEIAEQMLIDTETLNRLRDKAMERLRNLS